MNFYFQDLIINTILDYLKENKINFQEAVAAEINNSPFEDASSCGKLFE